MIVHNSRVPSEEGQPHFRLLCSDFHLGSVCSDHEEITRDLDRAKAVGARVLINGDVFDCIGPTDKRSDAGVLHPSLHGKKDLTGAIVEMAYELLYPYRELIDVIGIGNHEEAWIKYNHSDPVRLLIDMLNAAGAKIRHGSFWGFINTSFKLPGTRIRPTHRLLYFHGSGGDSPVTKGTIDINRKGRNWKYDCLTFGHKHNMVSTVEQIAEVNYKGQYTERPQLNLQTGSYFRNYREISEKDPLSYSYAASKAHPPKPMGGTFLILRPLFVDGAWTIKQDYASDIVVPWKKRRTA